MSLRLRLALFGAAVVALTLVLFGGLLYAQRGDAAYLRNYDTGAVRQMQVSRVVGRVAWNDAQWMSLKTNVPTVTLQTCVDYNPKGDRYIVQLT